MKIRVKEKLNYNFKKRKRKNIFDILFGIILTIVVIFNSGYVLMMTPESKPIYLLLPITLIMVTLLLFSNKRISIRSYYTLSFICLIFFCIVTYLINLEFSATNLYINTLCLITLSFCVSWFIEFDSFISIYIKVMKYITLISLIFYTLSNYFGFIFSLPVISTINADYYNGFIFFQFVSSSYRNTGIFWEPGLFASFIAIALVYEISFKKNKDRFFNITIFFLGLLSTNSTAGFLLIPFIIILMFADKANTMSQVVLLLIIIVFTILIIIFSKDILLFLVNINPSLFTKLLYKTSTSITRINGPLLNLEIFSRNPIFGVGLGNATRLFVEQAFSRGIDSQTSTSTFFMAAIGLPGVMYTYNWVHGIFGLKYKNVITRTTIFIIFIIILNKEPHSGLVLTFCIMFFFLKEANKYRGNIKY